MECSEQRFCCIEAVTSGFEMGLALPGGQEVGGSNPPGPTSESLVTGAFRSSEQSHKCCLLCYNAQS